VIEAMLREGHNVGGEQSGHMIFRDYATTGDGIVSALQILRVMIETGKPLSELQRQRATAQQVKTFIILIGLHKFHKCKSVERPITLQLKLREWIDWDNRSQVVKKYAAHWA
jgi:phosphomannomutase